MNTDVSTGAGTGARILVTTAAALGHFHPLAAIADALRAVGAEVLVACSPTFCEQVVASGFDAVGCGIDWQSRDLAETWPDFAAVPEPERNHWVNVVMWGSRLPSAMAPDLRDVVADWRPSVVLSGRVELAGPTVAEAAGTPYASTSAGRVIGLDEFVRSTREGRDDLRRSLGLPPDPRGEALYRHLYLNSVPDFFLPPGDLVPPTRRDHRPPAFADPLTPVPDWLEDIEEGSAIYVTLGSILGEVRPDAFDAILDAVADLGREVVVTTGPRGGDVPAAAGRPNIRVARYIPQRNVLDRAAVVVCHGGINTLLGALAEGCPVVVLPSEQSDQRWNARRCVEQGLGTCVDMNSLDVAALRGAVETVLAGPGFARRAQECAATLKALPPVERAAELVLELAGRAS